jgi:steroid delta-isomerase-like uncharacterized protein
MSVQGNTVLARRFGEVWGTGSPAIVDDLGHPNLTVTYPARGETIRGAEAFKGVLAQFHTAFPDLDVSVEEEVAEGDKVAVQWTLRGAHRGELMAIAPTGKAVVWTGITIYTVAGGRILEERGEGDTLGLMRQLGAIPASPGR